MRAADLRDPDVRTDDEGYRIDEHGNRTSGDGSFDGDVDGRTDDRRTDDGRTDDGRPADHRVTAADPDTDGYDRDRLGVDDTDRPDAGEGGTSRPHQHNV
jgi:hypothetical protein